MSLYRRTSEDDKKEEKKVKDVIEEKKVEPVDVKPEPEPEEKAEVVEVKQEEKKEERKIIEQLPDVTLASTNSISMLIRGVKNTLEAKGFLVQTLDTKKAIKTEYNKLGYVVILATDDLADVDADMIIKQCAKAKHRIILVGYPQNNAPVKAMMDDSVLAGEFDRPVDFEALEKMVVKNLKRVMEGSMKKHILIIDDQPMFLRSAMSWFEDKYKVSVAPSFSKGKKIIDKHKPDLILLDYEMPLVSGEMAFSMMAADKKYKDIPVIFLTSKSDIKVVKKLINMKPAGYLLKTERRYKIVHYVDEFFAKKMK